MLIVNLLHFDAVALLVGSGKVLKLEKLCIFVAAFWSENGTKGLLFNN